MAVRTGRRRAGYAPVMAYRGQFDRLIKAEERGRAITSTRTIAVFDDGLVVCAVGVYGDARPARGMFGSLRLTRRPPRRGSGRPAATSTSGPERRPAGPG